MIYSFTTWNNLNELYNEILYKGKHSKYFKQISESEFPKEIERKWLIKRSVDNIPIVDYILSLLKRTKLDPNAQLIVKESAISRQWYLSPKDPEIRYREITLVDYLPPKRSSYGSKFQILFPSSVHNTTNYLAYKSSGDLVRDEIEFEIDDESANRIKDYIRSRSSIDPIKLAIQKHVFFLEDKETPNVTYVVSLIDVVLDAITGIPTPQLCNLEVEFPDTNTAETFKLSKEISKLVEKEVTNDPSQKMSSHWAMTRPKYYKTEKISDKKEYVSSSSDDDMLESAIKMVRTIYNNSIDGGLPSSDNPIKIQIAISKDKLVVERIF